MAQPVRRDIVVVGASAGGVEALRALVAGLPAGLHAALFVVLHIPPDAQSLLPVILSRSGPLPASGAIDGEPVRHGHIYVAPPNHHLLVERDRVRIMVGPHENGLRPAADPLFRSAAHAYGERVAGVVLSGTRDDGTAGLFTIKQHGGLAVVQDPDEAIFPGMPESALAGTPVDYCLPVAEISHLIVDLARIPAGMRRLAPDITRQGTAGGDQGGSAVMADATAGAGRADGGTPIAAGPASQDVPMVEKEEGRASGLTCPECRGSLWEAREGDAVWFECRVNHRYSFQSMLSEQARTVEAAIWAAINVLEERAALLRKQSARAEERGNHMVASRFAQQGHDAQTHADTIRTQLLGLVQTFSAAE